MSSNITQAFICDAIRTPFGRYGGALSSVRTDDLGAIPIRALMARNPKWIGPWSPTSCMATPIKPVKTTVTWRT
jgi:acetyl-CoA acetyltransferase